MKIKENMPIVIGTILLILLCGMTYYFTFQEYTMYYAKIDNTKMNLVEGDMQYEYNLTAYKENGSAKEIKFKTSRELKQDAYIELKYMIVRGVVSWKEVYYEELTDKVQEKYK